MQGGIDGGCYLLPDLGGFAQCLFRLAVCLPCQLLRRMGGRDGFFRSGLRAGGCLYRVFRLLLRLAGDGGGGIRHGVRSGKRLGLDIVQHFLCQRIAGDG